MGSFIAVGKRYIREVASSVSAHLEAKYRKRADFRVAFIAYRDFGDAGQLVVTPFSADISAVCAAVDRETASGGGDAPEDVAGAFHKAKNLSWRKGCANFMILICDAPCHNTPTKRFHSYDDSWPHAESSAEKGHRGYLDPDDQLVRLRDEHQVHVMVTQIGGGSLDTMIERFTVSGKPARVHLCRMECVDCLRVHRCHRMRMTRSQSSNSRRCL
jgi:hypothetical protein